MAVTLEIRDALGDLGFETHGSYSVGNYMNYAISLTQASGGYYAVEVAVRLDKKDKKTARSLGKAFKATRPRRVFGVVNKGLSLCLNVRFDNKSSAGQQIMELLAQVVSVLGEHGITPARTCAVCGGASPESLALLNGYQPVHAGCVHQLVSQTEEEAENNRIHGSYLTGVLGALLGMIAGMIPNILTIVFLERIYAVLFALVPLASMWGYRKLGGKRTGASLAIVIVLSFLSVFMMSVLSTTFILMREFSAGFGEALSATVAYMFSSEGTSELLLGNLVPILFMGLGVWIAWRFLNRTNDGTVQNAQAAAATLRPNPNESITNAADGFSGAAADSYDM